MSAPDPQPTSPGPAGTPRVSVLCERADFLRAARAGRAATAGFLLQARARDPGEGDGLRVGFTCSRKVGNAVARNRAKRRLRAVAREILPQTGRDGWDYVLIGRPVDTAARPFDALRADLRGALDRVHRARGGQ